MTNTKSAKLLALLGATFLVVAACTGGGATTAPTGTAAPSGAPSGEPSGEPTGEYTLGFSNPLGVGNGFREEQLCTAVAQAAVSGEVSDGTWIHRNTDAAGQLSDIRTLIAAEPSAIIFNPLDAEALNDALDEAQEAGIVTVAIDAAVTDPETYNLSNDQVAYGRIGAEWLFEHIGGEGRVWYTRGIAGHPADTDRHEGVMEALANYPDIELWPTEEGVHTNWDPTTATNLANEMVASPDYDTLAGIWTSGMDSQVVDAIQAAGKDFVPIVGADLRAFVEQLLNVTNENNPDGTKYEGLEGIAVFNPAAVGGAGVTLALQVLNGEEVETTEGNTVLLPEPEAYDNVSDEGKAGLAEINEPTLDPLYPVSWYIDGWTDYTLEQMLACTGPGKSS